MKYGKVVTLILVGLPVLALGQAPQAKPTQPATAPAQQPQPAASSNSKRFVTNENFYRATPRPQPGTAAPISSQPSSAAPAYIPATATAMRPNAMPVPQVQSTVMASTPGVVRIPQQVQAQPVATVEQNSSAAVDYASGRLTIVADHAPLGSILKLIAVKTGATVDVAPELQNEPVVARLGPDSVRDVLSGLLDSPRIDYIVFGTGDEPGSLQRIVVRRRNSFGQMAAFRPQPNVVQPSQQLDPDGNPIPAANLAEGQMTPEQRMANWQKTREQMLQEEIKQQAEEREREKTQPAEQPAPQDFQQQDNPPL